MTTKLKGHENPQEYKFQPKHSLWTHKNLNKITKTAKKVSKTAKSQKWLLIAYKTLIYESDKCTKK